jgi:hypothetical protein
MTTILFELGIRFVVFGGVLWFAARRSDKITIEPRLVASRKWLWGCGGSLRKVPRRSLLPLVALVFATLNVGLYWLLAPLLDLATFGALWIATPFVVNGALLYATTRVVRPLHIEGVLTMVWLAALLTLAHGALYLGLDVLAPRWA